MEKGQERVWRRKRTLKYEVELESRARREFLALSGEIRQRITDVIDDLEANPQPPTARRLAGVDGYRVRKGDYRVLYTVDDDARLVRIYRIGHRREIYRRL